MPHPLPHPQAPPARPAVPGALLGAPRHEAPPTPLHALPLVVPPDVHRTVQSLVVEYAGAVAPGRVVALALATAVAERRGGAGWRRSRSAPDFLEHWSARTRRRLTEEVATDLARTASARAHPPREAA